MNGKSIYKVIGESFSAFNGSWAKILGATVLSVGTMLGLMLFPLFGFFLGYFAMGFICLGQKKFVLGQLNKKYLPVESVFSCYKQSLQAFALKTLIILYSLLWSLVLIVPGIVCMLNYSFTSFIMAEKSDANAFKTLSESKALVYGYRTKILFLVLFAFLIFCAFGAVGYGVTAIIGVFANLPVWAIVLITVLPAVLGGVLVAIPFFEISMAKLYLEAKKENTLEKERKKSKKQSQTL